MRLPIILSGFLLAFQLTTDQQVYWPSPPLAKPGYLKTVIDPVFKSTITRIVGDPGTAISGLPGQRWANEQERHGYSKRAVWNADQTMIYLDRHSPSLWLDGNTYKVLFTRKKPSSLLLWSPVEPHIMYHVGKPGNCQLSRYDVIHDQSTKLIDLNNYIDCSFGKGEGNFTNDGAKVAICGIRKSDGKEVIFVADAVKRTKGKDIETDNIDNCTLSPLGTYLVINDNKDHLKVLDAKDGRLLWKEDRYGLPSHFDVQIDQEGDEVIVGVGKTAPYEGKLVKRRLVDGKITALIDKGYASHTSGRNIKRLGWVYVTYANTNLKYPPYINEVDAVKLDGSSIERICQIRVNNMAYPTKDQYYLESQACPSPDGHRVIFAGDWGTGHYPVQAYVAKLIVTP